MRFQLERAAVAGSFGDVVRLVEDDDAVLDDFLVVGEEVGVEEVVVGHDEEGGEVLRLHRVEVRTEHLLPPYLLHDVYVQQPIGQSPLPYAHHLLPLLVEEAGRLEHLWVLLTHHLLPYPLPQLHPFPTRLYLLLPLQQSQVLLQAELLPRREDGHIGTIARFGEFLLHLSELRVRPRHVDYVVLDLGFLELLLDEGED